MGSTCGGVANACCSTDINVDIRNQVEGEHNNQNKSQFQSSAQKIKGYNSNKYEDPSKLMNLPPGHPDRIAVDKLLDRAAAVIKGFLARQKVRKIKFINRTTGKKAPHISREELLTIPTSNVLIVNLKEMEFGQLKLSYQE